MEGNNPVKSFGPAKGLNASKFFDRIRFRDVAALVGAIAVLLLAMGISSVSYKIQKEGADALDNHARVEENSQLEYYLVVKSDGVDKNGVKSTDSTMANIGGGITTVMDRIPNGLEFVGFKTTETGTIGAVARSDAATSCPGHVIDDTKEEKKDAGTWDSGRTEYFYHGLHYDVATRTVSFKAENIQAGCDLTVGIITKTPSLGTQKRMDFYNTANLKTGILDLNSNTFHSYIAAGKEEVPAYDVAYSYTGTVPDGAPSAPSTQAYAENASVSVEPSPNVDGYQFSGWQTRDVAVSNGSFAMPASTVAFTGSFTTKPAATKYNATYVIDGGAPVDYIAPKTRQYEAGQVVTLDSLSKNAKIDDWSFNGWTSENVELSDKGFTMPARNVEIRGSFIQDTYEVAYAFEGEVLPPNAEALLPEAQEYVPGAKVTRAADPVAEGYKFTGWYKNESFIMPEENVVIYGEWSIQNGIFSPEISIKITNPMKKYGLGDTVKFEVEVKNTASYPIKDVQVLEQLPGAVFVAGNGYEVKSGDYALVPEIPAGGTVKLNAVYEVQTGDEATLTNTVKIAGAIADNNYNFDDSKDYLASVTFDTALTGVPYDDTDNVNTRDRIVSYATLGVTALLGGVVSIFMIRRTLKNDQLMTIAPKAKGGLQTLKNIFNPNTATKGRLLSFAVADIALFAIAVGLGVKLLPQKIADISDPSTINLMSSHADYDAGEGGAWKITKSAKWTGDGKAQLTIDVDTVAKNANGKYTDVLFVVDVSGSMTGAKLDRVKQDMTELTDSLMSNGQNQVAMVSFESGAKKKLDFTTDKSAAQTAIDSLSTSGCTNYYQAFKEAEGILENYQAQNNRDLFLLFLTDGYPNRDTPNEQAEYAYLKGAYPAMVINAIQYEMASEILDPIKAISDNQYIADMDTLNNVLFEASRAPYFYDNFNVEDAIDTRYFEVDSGTSVEALNSSLGTAELTEENGQQRIKWNMDGVLRSGQSAKLTINLKLKDQYKRVAGEYPTNSNISATFTTSEGRAENENSSETPVLKNAYDVVYEANGPSACQVNGLPNQEKRFVYEIVEVSELIPTCQGNNFGGYVISNESTTSFNNDFFRMPENDVTIRATWTKSSIEKRAEGEVFSVRTLYDTVARKSSGADSASDYDDYNYNTQGKIYTVAATENEEHPIHYFRGRVTDNYVLFADYCWKIVRTTETGGVKIIYLGRPDTNGKCSNTTSKTYGITDIGAAPFNTQNNSPAYVGYMYGTVYPAQSRSFTKNETVLNSSTLGTSYWYANSARFGIDSENQWGLIDAHQVSSSQEYPDLEGQYTFRNSNKNYTSSNIQYIVRVLGTTYYYITLSGETDLESQNHVYTYGYKYEDEGDGTYTIQSPSTIERAKWAKGYYSVQGRYLCKNAVNNSCSELWHAAKNATSTVFQYTSSANKYKFSNSFTYNNGTYTLDDSNAVSLWDFTNTSESAKINNAHYTCFNDSGQCSTLSYVFYVDDSNYVFNYINLQNGKSIENALDEMNVNSNSSNIKTKIDTWYSDNLDNTVYEDYLEDTVFCNDRELVSGGLFSNGGKVTEPSSYASIRASSRNRNPDLNCRSSNDSFTVSEEKGNGALRYPIGLLSREEEELAFWTGYLGSGRTSWGLSPGNFSSDGAKVSSWDSSVEYYKVTTSLAVRPVVSIAPDILATDGNGNYDNPYKLSLP